MLHMDNASSSTLLWVHGYNIKACPAPLHLYASKTTVKRRTRNCWAVFSASNSNCNASSCKHLQEHAYSCGENRPQTNVATMYKC